MYEAVSFPHTQKNNKQNKLLHQVSSVHGSNKNSHCSCAPLLCLSDSGSDFPAKTNN